MQLIVSAQTNSVIESLLWKKGCPKVYMISFCDNEFFFDKNENTFTAN